MGSGSTRGPVDIGGPGSRAVLGRPSCRSASIGASESGPARAIELVPRSQLGRASADQGTSRATGGDQLPDDLAVGAQLGRVPRGCCIFSPEGRLSRCVEAAFSKRRHEKVVVASKASHAVVRREHGCHQAGEAFLVGALDRRLDELPPEAFPLMGVFDDEGEFRVGEVEPLPPSDTVNRPGIVGVDDDERSATVIIHGAEVLRLGGTKLWLHRCEAQVMGFLTASVVKLDQRGFIRGRYRSQCPRHGYVEFV